jgi:hypothetical protein
MNRFKLLGEILKQYLWCSWKHRKDRCYPEVWKVEKGNWHCAKCHPCSEGMIEALKMVEKLQNKDYRTRCW